MPQTKKGGGAILNPDYGKGGVYVTGLSWVLLIGVLGGTGWVWWALNNPKHGVTGCCGCGKCAHTGECVMVRKKAAQKGDAPS